METNQEKIDFGVIANKIMKQWRLYLKVLPCVLIGTYLLTICVPRYYRCTVMLAPESDNMSSATGSISSLASSFGLGGLSKLAGNNDAIYPLIYPDLLSSPNFIVTLFPVKVKTKDGEISTNYYDYIKNHKDVAPWEKYIINPIASLFESSSNSNFKGSEQVQVFSLDKTQQDIIKQISGNIKCSVDKKTDIITISVEDQDPFVSATLADSVLHNLQNFIINYRTEKARRDLEYYKKLGADAKQQYEKARQKYGSFSDSNTDPSLQSIRLMTEDLENDMQLKYNAYSAILTQIQAAQAKLQERTPVFTPLKTAVVPIKPAGPKRMIISLLVTFLAFLVISVKQVLKD